MSADNPQLASLNWYDSGGVLVGQLQLDASISEAHGAQAEASSHQVETGSNVTDHVRPLPNAFSLEGVVTNTPLGAPATYGDGISGSVRELRQTIQTPSGPQDIALMVFQFDGDGFDRAKAVFGDLADAIQAGNLFSVTTTLAHYDSLVCLKLSVPRNAALSGSLRLSMDFQQIRFVDTQTVAALPARKKERGNKTGKQVDETTAEGQQQKQSLAHSMLNGTGTK